MIRPPRHWFLRFFSDLSSRLTLFSVLLLCSFSSSAQEGSAQRDGLLNELRKISREDLELRISELDSLIHYYDSIKEPCNLAVANTIKGNYLLNSNKEDDAAEYLIDAISLLDQHACMGQTKAYVFSIYADLYQNLGEYDKCDSIAREGIKLFKDHWEDKRILVQLYLNIGFVANSIEEAIPSLDTALQLSKKYGLDDLESVVYINKGAVYAENEQFDSAQLLFEKALAIRPRDDDEYERYTLFNNLAGVIALQSDSFAPRVLSMMDSAIHYGREAQDLRSVQDFYENKAYYLRMHGFYDSAYSNLWRAHVLKDTILDQAKYEAVVELEQQFEAEKRSNEIQALKVQNLNSEVDKLRMKKSRNKFIIGSIVLLFSALFLAFNFIVLRKNRNLLAEKNKIISEEQQRSEHLLLNILPKQVAEDLKSQGYSSAKRFDETTILFTDFINFTHAAELMETEELVSELNAYFMKFDKIVESYGLEKIKTIGDSYMVAGGLQERSPDSAKYSVLAALDMQHFVDERAQRRRESGKVALEMRAGLHTGPVVAGIVGIKKYQYDVWGDTVNTASRMESNGIKGKVNISKSTYDLIKDDSDFTFEYRGKINAKGKGDVDMYFVQRKM